jgi:pimeloyl-ACP methyl ester carboxylesterase
VPIDSPFTHSPTLASDSPLTVGLQASPDCAVSPTVLPALGNQRDWCWRGWTTRYTFFRATAHGAADNNPPLLFVHGFGASLGHWRHNFEPFQVQHNLYALDLIGFGASSKVARSYHVSFWVEQLYDFWQTFIQRPVVLVGNSIGSLVCMVAATHPEMVAGLVLLNLPDTTLRDDMIPAPIRPVVMGIERLFMAPWLLKPLFYFLRRPKVIRAWAGRAYENRDRITDELVELLAAPAQDPGAAETFVALFQSIPKSSFGPSAKEILPTLDIPILLLWGKQDCMVPVSLAQTFAAYNPRITLIELDSAGHCPHDECPEAVNGILADWLAQSGLAGEDPIHPLGRASCGPKGEIPTVSS